MANLCGRAARAIRSGEGAAQPAAIAPAWDCPWPLRYRVLADLVDADGHLPHSAPGVVFDGDDVGTWLQRAAEPGDLDAAAARAARTADRTGHQAR
ncbi:hypothetical protein GCM10017562_02520 [Streptomyces roseofulvus]